MKINTSTMVVGVAFLCVSLGVSAQNKNPLSNFIGTWEGDKGVDVAPAQKKNGSAGTPVSSPYFERIEITEGPSATNASEQNLTALVLRQKVYRKSDGKQFHDQIGYLIWDASNRKVIYSFCIPRGVCVSADGEMKNSNEFIVKTSNEFAEADFVRNNAKTNDFFANMKINPDGTMSYSLVTGLTSYGKLFSHVDSNSLVRASGK